ncbi:uncharacterized protein LOC116352359 [Contarinia nasturtii]|uniref:uncharacterized protein LOC116352359 n=1 Tax=Contarinia nasturtii TaxID=265458 RepID=UPI0012D4C3D2|nr:uncharacterized protein LOC116352359 [Contarinia nasturtii]
MKCLFITAIFCLIAIVLTSKSQVQGESIEYRHRLKRQSFSGSTSSSSTTSSGNGPIMFQQTSSSFQSQGPVGNGHLESRFGENGGSSGHVSYTSGTYDPNTKKTYIYQNIHQAIPVPIQVPIFNSGNQKKD